MPTLFRLDENSVLQFNSNTLECVVSISFSEVGADHVSQCIANATQKHVIGFVNVTGTINFEFEDDHNTELGYLDVKTSGALAFDPAGTASGTLDISSTKMQIQSRDLTFSGGQLSGGSANFVCDDLTIGANV